MKRLRYILLFLVTNVMAVSSFAQVAPPKLQWAKCYGGSSSDIALNVRHLRDNSGYIVCGLANSSDGEVVLHHGSTLTADYWVIRLNDTGAIMWQQVLGGSGDDFATDVKETSDGGFIVAGYSKSNDGNVQGHHGTTGSADYWIVKLDAAGKIKWSKSYGGTGNDEAYSVDETKDGGFVVAGFSASTDGDISANRGGEDYWIIKLDASGVLQWERSLGGSQDDDAFSVRQTSDGGYIVAGSSMSSDGDVTRNVNAEDYWIVKLDSIGKIVWQKSYGGSGSDVAYNIEPTSDGGYIAIGYSNSPNGDVEGNHGQEDFWIVKLDAKGMLQWDRSLGGDNIDIGYKVLEMPDHTYVVSGAVSSNNGNVTGNHGGNDYWIAKLDNTGVLLWENSFGGTGDEFCYGMDTTSDSGFILAGETTSSDGQVTGHLAFEDYWIVKLTPEGIRDVHTSIATSQSGMCYPNPFSDRTTITFGKTITSDATLTIYNILGAPVRIVKIPDGANSIRIEREDLTSGAYSYRVLSETTVLESGNFIVQ
jgi:hypothetical protein